eukprot:768288-Hanusia_phi.AAC.4
MAAYHPRGVKWGRRWGSQLGRGGLLRPLKLRAGRTTPTLRFADLRPISGVGKSGFLGPKLFNTT